MTKKGCTHNAACPCIAGRRNCRAAVEGKECNPPTRVRISLGITLVGVDAKDFADTLKKNGGCLPMKGFVPA